MTSALHTSHRLSAEQLDQYRRTGYLVLRAFFSRAEMAGWVAECERLAERIQCMDESDGRRQQRKHLSLGTIYDRLDPVSDFSRLFGDLSNEPRLLAVVGDLVGEPALVMKDKLIIKPPGTFGYGIHQDYPYWERTGIPPDAVLTAWVAIDETIETNGAPEVFSGQHGRRIPGTLDEPLDVDERLLDTSTGVLVELNAGDVFLFHSLMPHRSAPNRSKNHRRALLITYAPVRYKARKSIFYRPIPNS